MPADHETMLRWGFRAFGRRDNKHYLAESSRCAQCIGANERHCLVPPLRTTTKYAIYRGPCVRCQTQGLSCDMVGGYAEVPVSRLPGATSGIKLERVRDDVSTVGASPAELRFAANRSETGSISSAKSSKSSKSSASATSLVLTQPTTPTTPATPVTPMTPGYSGHSTLCGPLASPTPCLSNLPPLPVSPPCTTPSTPTFGPISLPTKATVNTPSPLGAQIPTVPTSPPPPVQFAPVPMRRGLTPSLAPPLDAIVENSPRSSIDSTFVAPGSVSDHSHASSVAEHSQGLSVGACSQAYSVSEYSQPSCSSDSEVDVITAALDLGAELAGGMGLGLGLTGFRNVSNLNLRDLRDRNPREVNLSLRDLRDRDPREPTPTPSPLPSPIPSNLSSPTALAGFALSRPASATGSTRSDRSRRSFDLGAYSSLHSQGMKLRALEHEAFVTLHAAVHDLYDADATHHAAAEALQTRRDALAHAEARRIELERELQQVLATIESASAEIKGLADAESFAADALDEKRRYHETSEKTYEEARRKADEADMRLRKFRARG